MFTDSVLVKVLIGIVYGTLLGAVTVPLSKKLTLNRSEDPVKAAPLNKSLFKILSIAVGIIASVAVSFTAEDTASFIRNLLILIPMFSIAVVDALIRKIPNSLLLVMIIIQVPYITYTCVIEKSPEPLFLAFVGFIIGFASCAVPSKKLPIGSGDTKYCAMIGGTLGLTLYMQSVILMGLIGLVVLVYLKVSKKGGVKTMIPMGPLISLSSVISICFPILLKLIGNIWN